MISIEKQNCHSIETNHVVMKTKLWIISCLGFSNIYGSFAFPLSNPKPVLFHRHHHCKLHLSMKVTTPLTSSSPSRGSSKHQLSQSITTEEDGESMATTPQTEAEKQLATTTFQSIDPYYTPSSTAIQQVAGVLYGISSFLLYATVFSVIFTYLPFVIRNIQNRMMGGSGGIGGMNARMGQNSILKGQGQGGGGGGGKTDELLKYQNITLASFMGSQEVKQECVEIIDIFRNYQQYKAAHVDIPRGFLLEGPPGCGKTLLAKIIASESNMSFISVSGSEFVEMYVGLGAQRIRDLFDTARKNKPCVIFIDEIDAVGKRRSMSSMGSNNEQEQTLNQLLYEMDGLNDNEQVFVLGSTNRKDILDPALVRPGRFDRVIYIPHPDAPSRLEMLKHFLKKRKYNESMDINAYVELTAGMSGAELKNLVNEAAIEMVRRNESTMTLQAQDLFSSLEKVTIGVAKQNDSRSFETRRKVAIHELGHAMLVNAFPESFVLQKVSIKATYKNVGGVTIFNPKEQEMTSYTELKHRLVVLLGGRAAEELYFGPEYCSTGASHDLQQASELAIQMIGRWGFGKSLYILGERSSDRTTYQSESEVRSLLRECYEQAMEILKANKTQLDALIQSLLEKEIIYASEFHHDFVPSV